MWTNDEFSGQHMRLGESDDTEGGGSGASGGWSSGKNDSGASQFSVVPVHRMLCSKLALNLSEGFANIQRELTALQLQLQLKVQQIADEQTLILQTNAPSNIDAVTEFEENVKKIERAMESFVTYACNLAHIKLTLARAAAFVSPEGNFAQLITVMKPAKTRLFALPEFPSVRLNLANTMNEMSLGRVAQETAIAHGQTRRSCYPPPRSLLDVGSSSTRIPNATCFVFYLPPAATDETLRNLFQRFGTVLNAYVAMDKLKNCTRGFGFVDFSTPAEAQAAVNGLDKSQLGEKFLSVSIKI